MIFESGCRVNGKPVEAEDPEPGIAESLASERAQNIKDVRYDLSFTIPTAAADPIRARAIIRFKTTDTTQPVVLDFAAGSDRLMSVSKRYQFANGHIILPPEELLAGENTIEIAFRAGEVSLNRNPDFLYTLFVPARAHLAFPCFDQPDLKAKFSLELVVPRGWEAVTNGAELSRENGTDSVGIRYAETPPLPTYLFAFAAGKFQIETAERNGRTYRMFHRETDATKVNRNRDTVFDLHASSLQWLESYTAIPYQFGKFDFVVIPSFQFGGMEHPGAIFYNAAAVLLDESATENQMLNRASVIAHETAHMWFGDLVTMRWFNDVWMKEVFANFMAAKIVNPSFPKVNHDLRFLVEHYPSAYAVDRTAGTHAVRQELANLNDAGGLYGAIIYDKAPIVMRQLERMLGTDSLKEGLRIYLKQFEYGNATWLDLIRVLDERTDLDLAQWSRVWVEESGRPVVHTELLAGAGGGVRHLGFIQRDPQQDRGLRWTQELEVLLGTSAGVKSISLNLHDARTELPDASSLHSLQFVLPTGGGLGYGDFVLDETTRAFLLAHLPELEDPLARGAAWVTLWEEVLNQRVAPSAFMDLALHAVPGENTEQNIQLIAGYVDKLFWRFLPPESAKSLPPKLEQVLRSGLDRAATSSLKSTYFTAFRSVVTTPEGIAFLERVWRRQEKIPGLVLAEPDEATMALELAVRSVPAAADILEVQRGRFMNPDRKARFQFVMPALSERQETRDAFFASLSNADNRRHEPWVVEGLRYLNHPLRSRYSAKYVRPALDLLEEVRRTGDIFFPKNWTDAVLSGSNTSEAANVVRSFLDQHRDYPIRLRRVVLQSADDVFRAAEILNHERRTQ
jgi:aminopeptidase N